jgi:acyl-CoA thioester hydrolase, YbgC/YbaW family
MKSGSQKNNFSVKTELLVRFGDVDAMGHMNNAKYLTFFEQGRVAYFKELGELDLRMMDHRSAFGFIVAEIGIKYLAPAQMDDVLVVKVRVAEIRTKAFRMEYEICSKDEKQIIATGFSVQVMYDYKSKMTFEIPETLKTKILTLEKNNRQ